MTKNHNPQVSRFRRIASSALAASAVVSLSLIGIGAAQSGAAEPTILLYNAQGYGDKVVKAFNATNPGFKVVVYDDSTGPLFTKIQAEMAAGTPKWGVFWADGATEFAALDKKGYLVKNIVSNKVMYNAAGMNNLPADGSFAPTGLTVGGAFCYDKVAAKGIALPSTMAGLTSLPAGVLGMNDPSQSGPTFPLIAGVMAHLGGIKVSSKPNAARVLAAVNAGESFYLKLKKNGLQIHPTNGPTLGAMESNPATLAMATIQSSACYGDINAKPSYWPTGAVKYLDYSVALPSNLAIDSSLSPKLQADAEKFVNWVLTKNGQQRMQQGDPYGDGLFWPVIKGVTPEKYLPAYAATRAYAIDPYVWGPLENTINSWFTNNIIN